MREQLGRWPTAAIARTLDRSVAGVKLRLRRLRPHRRVLDPPPPPPVAIVAGGWVRVVGPVPAAPWCLGRVGRVDRVVWSSHPRLAAPEWRARVCFAKRHRRRPGAIIAYGLPLGALEPVADDSQAA
jgi:hypothetical protein